MFQRRNRSILFVLPDYHSSFALRDAIRKAGWASEILISHGYDRRYLFSNDVIEQSRPVKSSGRVGTTINIGAAFAQYMFLALRFKYHIHYSRLAIPSTYESVLPARLRSKAVHIAIGLAKMVGVVHVHVPSGCRDEATKKVFAEVEQGIVCGNCGFFDHCDDAENSLYLKRARRYSKFSVDSGFYESTELQVRSIRTKALDPERWRPQSGKQHGKVVVLHSHALETRTKSARNIKGTPIINEVMKRICEKYDHVEYRMVTGLTTRQMLRHQQEAHVVIDQIFYGHWGSTGVEAMGTGAVVVAYLRPEWMENFRRKFPQYAESVPVVSATAETLESVIERLVTDHDYREELSSRSINFARTFYDPDGVAEELIVALRSS